MGRALRQRRAAVPGSCRLYCYEKRKEAPGGRRIDASQVGQLVTIFRGRPLAIELHGGEPLTAGRDHLAELLRELAAQPSVVRVSLQTNGVQLDEGWLDMFDAVYPQLRIGISLDGDPDGNTWRVGYDGQPTYPRVAAALRLLSKRGRSVGIISAVTPRLLGRAAQVLDHLASFPAVNAVSLVPCFDATVTRATASPTGRISRSRQLQHRAVAGPVGPAWAVTPDEYTQFVLAAGVHWVQAGLSRRMKLEPVVSTLRRLRGLDTTFCHFSNLKCDHVFTLYPDGRLGSCDELSWPAAGLGNLDTLRDETAVAAAQAGSVLLGRGRSLMARCVSCSYRDTCGGGCIATRLRYAGVDDEDAYCRYRMRLVDGVAALLAQPADPAGVWCQRVRWRPRHPNTMLDVAGLLARWDDPTASRVAVQVRRSAHGNINTIGQPGVHEADDLDPIHPQWRAAIEDGVWPLVDAVTSRWGAVTYDSCQGHDYPGLDLAPAARRVGILPRDRGEYAAIAAALCRAVSEAAPLLEAPVRVGIGRSQLTCVKTGRRIPVLDLHLEPDLRHGWPAYFAAVDQATAVVAGCLNGTRPAPEAGCACPLPALAPRPAASVGAL